MSTLVGGNEGVMLMMMMSIGNYNLKTQQYTLHLYDIVIVLFVSHLNTFVLHVPFFFWQANMYISKRSKIYGPFSKRYGA